MSISVAARLSNSCGVWSGAMGSLLLKQQDDKQCREYAESDDCVDLRDLLPAEVPQDTGECEGRGAEAGESEFGGHG